MTPTEFAKLLELAKARKLAALVAEAKPDVIELRSLTPKQEAEPITEEEKEEVIDVLRDLESNEPKEPLHAATHKVLGVARDDIILNDKQQEFLNNVLEGNDVVLIGAAGTGKTTSMRQTTRELIRSRRLHPITNGTKYLHNGKPGGAILSYTRKAVNNIRHAVVDELKGHTLTIHKLLEFAPVFYEIEDPDNPGLLKKTMRFEPQRNAFNPLPSELTFLAFEESSMISVELYTQLQAAMPHPHQEVFLGDIQQLPPIFGLAILGFKMLELPVVELIEVYRQAMNSPIISLAWAVLGGDQKLFSPKLESYDAEITVKGEKKKIKKNRAPALDAFSVKKEEGEVIFQIWQNKISADLALITTVQQFKIWEQQGYYDPQNDIILCPFNKAFGTIELNKGISQHLGRKRGATVYEVIAGFNKHYLAVGDRVLYDKEDAYITSIRHNGNYLGKRTQPASVNLDRWGHLTEDMTEAEKLQASIEADGGEMDLAAIEKFMELAASVEERVNAASHVVEIRYASSSSYHETWEDEESDEVLDSAKDINDLLGGYAITVHKFQGSEADNVFYVTHQSHAVLNQREMLYTAVTRAKKKLHLIVEADTFHRGLQSQKVKGNSIKEKAEFFMGKKETVDKLRADGQLPMLLEHKSLKKQGEDAAPVTLIGGKPAVKLADLPSFSIRIAAEEELNTRWKDAIKIFGPEIGDTPSLSFDISKRAIVGSANFILHRIKLNPVWLAVAETDEVVRYQMLRETLDHEICHLVAAKKWHDFKHGIFWKGAMFRFTEKRVTGKDDAIGLPDWMIEKEKLVLELLRSASLSASVNDTITAETTETTETTVEEGEVE